MIANRSVVAAAVLLFSSWPACGQGVETRPLTPIERAFASGDQREYLRLVLASVATLPAAFADAAAEEDAEILLLRLHALVSNDPAGVLEALRSCQARGWIGARAAFARHAALADLGRFDEAAEEARRVGFIDRMLLCGPFDNERGAGQKGDLAPERGAVDPDATFDGKDRTVRWRTMGDLPPTAGIDLADVLVPKEQVLAFLACTITSPDARTVALGIGHSSFCRVLLNGSVVHEGEAQRDDAVPDQARVLVRLDAGPNELLVKTGVVTGPFRIALRLASPDGGPPPGDLAVSAAPESFARRRAESRPHSRPAGAVLDARASVEERARAADASAAELVRWARLRILLRLDDRAHPETSAFTARAVAAAPRDPVALDVHARALRRHTDIAAEREDNARVRALRDLIEVAPHWVPALSELARTYFEELRHVEVAIGFLDRALATNPRAADVLARLAQIRGRQGQDGLAESLLREAVAAGAGAERLALASWLMGRKRFREAREIVQEAKGVAPGSAGVLRTELALAEDVGDLDAAAACAERLVRRLPTDGEPRLRLATIRDARQDAAGSLAAIEDLLRFAPDLVESRRRAAILADRLGRRDVALDHLSHALLIEPGNARLRRLEGWLSGQEKSFEEAFQCDTPALVRAAPDFRENSENQPYRYLLARTIVRVNPDGTSGIYRHFVAQVLNQKGVDDLDKVHVMLESRDQRSRFKTARLFRGDAAPVEADRPWPGVADFPALQPGDVVEWAYRVDDLRQSFFGNYFGLDHQFQPHDLAGVRRSELILLLPKSRSFQFHQRNARLDPEMIAAPDYLADFEARRYVITDIEAVAGERAMPDPSEFVPTLQVSTYRSWDEFASWWWNLIHKQIDVSDAMRAKLREIVAGATTREEKIRAIYDFVVTDIRYVAWEFGVHGYKPYRVSAIFDRRFGDCKDKALVMGALLREVGIDAYPVLIRLDEPRSYEDHALALVQHFNHCIAGVAEPDGSFRFLDGTAEYHAMSDVPDGDRGAKVIVVRDGRAVEAVVPIGSPDDNLEREEIAVALQDDGKATVAYKSSMNGRHAVAARSRYVNEADRKEELGEVVNRRYGQGVLQKLDFSPLSDLSKPVQIAYTFGVDDLLNRDGDRARIRPLWSAFDWSSLAVTDKRRFDILLGPPSRTVSVAEISLPASWKIAAMPEDTMIEESFARYELKRSVSGAVVRLERTLTLREPRVEAADYPVFRRFVTQVAEADRETVTLEPAK